MGAARAFEDQARAVFSRCPHLRRVGFDQAGSYPSGWQCALRRGHFRAPSEDELAWFCTNVRFRACPIYRYPPLMVRGGHLWPTIR